eukprot:15470217-Alexandrium_andersonii.AAC.1
MKTTNDDTNEQTNERLTAETRTATSYSIRRLCFACDDCSRRLQVGVHGLRRLMVVTTPFVHRCAAVYGALRYLAAVCG